MDTGERPTWHPPPSAPFHAGVKPPSDFAPHPDEEVVAVLRPWWLVWLVYYIPFGLGELWRRRHSIVLTSERLVFTRGIVFNKSSRSVPLSRIQDATYARALFVGGVEISSAGGSFGSLKDIVFRPSEAKAFVRAVNEATRAHTSAGLGEPAPTRPTAGADAAESIRALAALRAEGLISEDEYERKRRELLERL